KIREVLELVKITRVPRTPNFMAGVINLRGRVVPVIDLRVKFDMEGSENTIDTTIIIVEVNYQEEIIIIGALVDSVKAVVRLEETQLEPPPKIGMNLDLNFIDAIGKKGNDFIIILNVDKIFSAKELSFLTEGINKEEENKDL
ncbi:MAG: chemotaxis protein CheW, partial [Spirochaetes bacterium GWD1_27_9]